MESDKVELSIQWEQHRVGVTMAFIPTHLHIAFTASSRILYFIQKCHKSLTLFTPLPPRMFVCLEVSQPQWLHAFILTET